MGRKQKLKMYAEQDTIESSLLHSEKSEDLENNIAGGIIEQELHSRDRDLIWTSFNSESSEFLKKIICRKVSICERTVGLGC